MQRSDYTQRCLGKTLHETVQDAHILMVGAGGIGCELLKNLVLTGYGEIHIVDLDTIDLSNLNRQFLFRHEHIKKSKALVAKEAALAFNPAVHIVAYHANIKDAQFNVAWFKQFEIVFNALDNLEARRHVNKMCLAADVPLIESGTTGFNGQVQVIKKGVTACYDCTPKETPKSFPVCTIRSTPSQSIHCIVWGKSYLLSEVFGASEDEASAMDHTQDSENAQEIEKLRQEAQALKAIRESMGTVDFPQLLFDKVYKDDIIRLRSMEEMWKSRRPPAPLDYATTLAAAEADGLIIAAVLKAAQRAWTLEENLLVFKDSLMRLSNRIAAMKEIINGSGAPPPIITFDKDDDDTLDFVAASANLRSIIFGIETKSKFDIKQMAGNIIPAIATTNAIVAGLCVLQSFKVLRGEFSSTKEIFLSPFASERLLASDRMHAPNPDCAVCSVAQSRILVDLSRATLRDLVEDFLRLEVGYGDEFVVNNDIGTLYDVEETENLSKKLSELGIKDDSFLTIIDEDEDEPRVNLVLSVQDTSAVVDGTPIKALDGKLEGEKLVLNIPRKAKVEEPPVDIAEVAPTAAQVSSTTDGLGASAKKRRLDEAFPETDNRRAKTYVAKKGDSEIVLVDDANGAIVIDDD